MSGGAPADRYDAAVVGGGVLGAALLGALARAGRRVAGFDAGAPPHRDGSSHGGTRLIRRAYFEDARYIPLLDRAYAGWDALAARRRAAGATAGPAGSPAPDAGRAPPAGPGAPALPPDAPPDAPIFERRGLAVYGERPDLLETIRDRAAVAGIALETLTPPGAAARFPAIRPPDPGGVVFEPDAGFLRAEPCVGALHADAAAAGAAFFPGCAVRGWRRAGSGFALETAAGPLEAAALFLAAGAWTAGLCAAAGVALPFALTLWRAPQLWFGDDPGPPGLAESPCFAFDLADGFYYGFPPVDGRGLKVAAYQPSHRITSPDGLASLGPSEEELAGIRRVVTRFFPGVDPTPTRVEMCMYTCSPGEDFLVDAHPEVEGLYLLAAGSGHAFKFAPALAEAIVTRSETGALPPEARFLGWRGA